MAEPQLPYFDYLLREIADENKAVQKAFGRHVHWGYWADPGQATGTDQDYADAAENMTLELCALAHIGGGQRVLDAGCGFGGTVAVMNELWQNLSLVGLNIDDRQLARAREQVLPIGRNSVEFVEGDACALPFPDASFDRVLAVECIFHFPSRAVFLKEAFRVLKPGGILAVSDFVPSRIFLPAAQLLNSPWMEKRNVFGHCATDCTMAGYRRMAALSGLVLEETRDITRKTSPTYPYVRRVMTSGLSGIGFWTMSLGARLQQLLAVSGLLRYRLLAFRKV